MAVVFGKVDAQARSASVVDAVFDRDVGVYSEKESDAPATNGSIRVIQDFRGHTAKGPGRKNAMINRTVLDLTACSTIPLNELPRYIERLTALKAELDDAFAADGEGDMLNSLLG